MHHHELLDGSGYPHGLKGAEIPDLTQLVTIVDIFSALIEPRTYKATMSSQEAYGILQGMQGKLDPALLEAFEPVVAACPDSGRAGHSGVRPRPRPFRQGVFKPEAFRKGSLEPVQRIQRFAR